MYMSHSIISFLGSLNNRYSDPYISILLNQKSTPGYMMIFADFRTESKLQSPHFMPGLGQPFSKYLNYWQKNRLQSLCNMPQNVLKSVFCRGYSEMGTDDSSHWKYGDNSNFCGVSSITLIYWSQICGDICPYQLNNWGHSWFYCAKCPHFTASA